MTYCMYCTKKIKEKNLNHNRGIICPACVQRLVGTKNIPLRRSVSPATARKVRGARPSKGKKPPTGVGMKNG
jgi:DNA-directed RNA polymerase subunit RPC12/RpoP